MTDIKGRLFDVQRFSVTDGPGIRTTVFFKGCNLRCAWCHNPESQSPKSQMLVYKNKCTGCGKCQEKCPNALETCELCGKCTPYCPNDAREICGKEYTADEIMHEILKDKAFYDNSEGGVTFSGGECMLQIEFLLEMLKECKKKGLRTAIDTAGNLPYDFFERVIPYTDLFLYDVKCYDRDTHEKYTGSSNERILNNLEKLLRERVPVWIRIPIISGVNDSTDEMEKIKAFIKNCGTPEKVELLPYHAMGEHKYVALGMKTQRFAVPNEEKMIELKKIFS